MTNARDIFNAASSRDPGDALEALGIQRPKTLADVWRAMRQAYEDMTPRERAQEDHETRVRLHYVASATKVPGAAPKIPDARYTKDSE